MSEDAEFIRRYPPTSRLRAFIYEKWLSLGMTKALKRRRVEFVNELLDGDLSKPGRVLEVGCGSGRDMVKLLKDDPVHIWGLDPFDAGIKQSNFTFVQGDMASIPFEDKYFNAVVSFGVLEHIEPFEKLAIGIKEMVRVSKKYCMVVPSISTRFEPHHWEYRWQMKRPNDRQLHLYYLSDAAWLNFEGFRGAKTIRFDYIPGLITCLVIHGTSE